MEEPNPPENRNIDTGGGNYNERIEGDYIQGNVVQNIFNFLNGQQLAPVGNTARPKNQRLLLADVKQEVTARLRQSLHNAVLINLGKESQPQQVKRPWDAEIKIGLKPAESLPHSTTILEVFDSEEIAGKLLILGAPGSGKTTTQLELAQALIKRAEEQPDYSIPVLFNLSSWKDNRQSIADWLVAELKSKYGVSKKLGREWVSNHQLLPLLDGLDELEPQRQEPCVQAINQFLASETRPPYLVVCSRIEEYSNYSSNLHLSGAISLRELNETQILRYFEAVGRIEFWHTMQGEKALLGLMRTPLFLSITVLSAQELSIEDWQQLETMEERIEYLFDAYWRQQMFNRELSKELYVLINRLRLLLDKYIRRLPVEPGIEPYTQHKPPTPKQTKLWLIWLAQQMQREAKTEFLIEGMQLSWMKNIFQKIGYNLILWGFLGILINGLLFLIITGMFMVSDSRPITILSSGLIWGLSIGLSSGLIGEIIGKNNYSQVIKYFFEDKTFKSLIIGFGLAPILGLVIGMLIPRQSLISTSILVGMLGALFYMIIGDDIKAIEKITFSFSKFLIGLISTTCFYVYILHDKMNLAIQPDRTMFIHGTLISGLLFALTFSISNMEIDNKTIPNQGIRRAISNSIILSIIIFLITILLTLIIQNIMKHIYLKQALFLSLVSGLSLGIFIAMVRSGKSAIKHFILRVFLYFNGYIPWNYARFLEYCTERLFLQRVGGRYRFIHKLLQDHFAQMDFKRD